MATTSPSRIGRAAVVGGSIGGLAAALALGQAGYDVTVLERSNRLEDRGAGIGVDLALVATVGRQLGVPEEATMPSVTTNERREIVVERGAIVDDEVVRQVRDHAAWAGLWRFLRHGFEHRVVRAEVVSVVADPNRSAAPVEVISDVDREWYDAVIVADGYQSRFRFLVEPGHAGARYAGYVLWRGVLDLDRSTPDELRRLVDDRFLVATTSADHVVAYPIPGAEPGDPARLNWGWYRGATLQQVHEWFRRPDGTVDPRSIGPSDLPAATRAMVADSAVMWPEPVRGLVDETVAQRRLFAAGIFEHAPMALAAGPIALVGDAAHTASPITGAGAKHALIDGLALAEALATTDDVTVAFRRYEAARLPVVLALVADGQHWGLRFKPARARLTPSRSARFGR